MPSQSASPKLAIVIHTEEEFDWNGGFNPTATEVSHGAELLAAVENLKEIGAKCTLAMDYAFVTSEQGLQCINKINADDELIRHVEFAAHLHPWVNPPLSTSFTDKVPEQFSYPGNLPEDEEYNKLSTLTKEIDKYRYIKGDIYEGVLPEIERELISERDTVRKFMRTVDDLRYKTVLNKRQLSHKISGNTVYGALGAQERGTLPLIQASRSITAKGRTDILLCNDFLEKEKKLLLGFNVTKVLVR